MPRLKQPIGTWGEIHTVEFDNGQVQARCRFRDYDGRTRLVARRGRSAEAAKRALRAALKQRTQHRSAEVVMTTTVEELADLWIAAPHNWSAQTRRVYETYAKQVKLALGQVMVGELTPARIGTALAVIAERHAGSARTARTVLSGMMKLAIANGAISVNPVRDSTWTYHGRRPKVRAFTAAERRAILAWMREDKRCTNLDLPDLVEFLLGTGARIGEALAGRDATIDIDAKTWLVDSTVIRVPGVGLQIQPHTKSEAGVRLLALPDDIVRMLARRQNTARLEPPEGVVFGSPNAPTLRDPSNCIGDIREAFDRIECPKCSGDLWPHRGKAAKCKGVGPYQWVTSHKARKTVATLMDDAGLSARQVSNQLGQARPSIAQDYYMDRTTAPPEAAVLLLHPSEEQDLT